uniref:laccase n=1 Tax=Fagus sylvatica TaxID=28930 RepID=A0A2N9EJ67_FAGSY
MVDEALAKGGDPNVSDAYTINGRTGFPNGCSDETPSNFTVEYGKTYIFRMVNAVMNEEMFFGVAEHNLTVVAQDGAYIKPIPTSYIMITPGQTMDVLITANHTGRGSYYMVARPFLYSRDPFDRYNASAILREAADDFTRRIKAFATPEHPVDVPQEIDERIFITISVNELPCDLTPNDTCGGPTNSASLNNISFAEPKSDILLAYYSNLNASHDDNAPASAPLPFDDDFPAFPPVPFDYTGVSPDEYLLPSQGRSFYLVGTGCGNFYTDPNYHHDYNLIDPPKVNTIGVPKNGWAAIRFVADNPGLWFMHCHLERHASWGMDIVLIVKNGPNDTTSICPPPSLPRCT